MMTDSSLEFEITEFMNKCIQNGKLTKYNCTNNAIIAKLVSEFMRESETRMPRPKVRMIWYEVMRKQMMNDSDVSIDESAMNEKIDSSTEKSDIPFIRAKDDKLKQQIKNVMMSYDGNWVIDSFGTNRKEKIVKFIWFKFNLINTEHIEMLYDEILHELAEMDIRPYGQ